MAARDMDVIRKVLLEIEKHEYTGKAFEIGIAECSKMQTQYHLALLNEARLILAEQTGNRPSGERWLPIRLTWDGHEFLDDTRDPDLWHRILEKAKGLSFEIIRELAKDAVRQTLSGP